ncbi:hypothetical protein AAFF_G00254010 [Aldrovandia affinis]|uniref:Uncharacterized protein n=1 Tax=Aldrovandia affinis TaxID=143900 RepID=A0AAD7QZT8_9TELE|nr:hypothetical protein AAFF_G00254010 [Aldrovandia affinis]
MRSLPANSPEKRTTSEEGTTCLRPTGVCHKRAGAYQRALTARVAAGFLAWRKVNTGPRCVTWMSPPKACSAPTAARLLLCPQAGCETELQRGQAWKSAWATGARVQRLECLGSRQVRLACRRAGWKSACSPGGPDRPLGVPDDGQALGSLWLAIPYEWPGWPLGSPSWPLGVPGPAEPGQAWVADSLQG